MKSLFVAAAVAGALLLAPLSDLQAQERPCMASMSHLIDSRICKQRMGCLRTHLQYLSRACLTRLSAQNEKRFLQRKHRKTTEATPGEGFLQIAS